MRVWFILLSSIPFEPCIDGEQTAWKKFYPCEDLVNEIEYIFGLGQGKNYYAF